MSRNYALYFAVVGSLILIVSAFLTHQANRLNNEIYSKENLINFYSFGIIDYAISSLSFQNAMLNVLSDNPKLKEEFIISTQNSLKNNSEHFLNAVSERSAEIDRIKNKQNEIFKWANILFYTGSLFNILAIIWSITQDRKKHKVVEECLK